MAVSKLSLFLAFGLFAMVAGRPMTLDAMGDSTLASRELLSSSCGTSGCNTSTPGCDFVQLLGVCYFTKAMLNAPIMPVTSYYCGLGCPETPYHYYAKGYYNTYVQRTCPAVTCAKTIGQVSAQGSTGCASSSGYINGLAIGQTTDLYYNVDGHWLATQFQSFCADPTASTMVAVAGMVAEGLASSLAATSLIGTQYVCGCCDGHETATQSIAGYTTATARARVQAFVQALTGVFGPGDCSDPAILTQASTWADALSEDLVTITTEWHNSVSLSKFGDRNLYNHVCTNASVPNVDALKVKYANAYACAIVSALSAAGKTSNGTATTITFGSDSCSDNYEIAFSSDWVPGHHTASCVNACKCNPADYINGKFCNCAAGTKVCPGSSCEYVDF